MKRLLPWLLSVSVLLGCNEPAPIRPAVRAAPSAEAPTATAPTPAPKTAVLKAVPVTPSDWTPSQFASEWKEVRQTGDSMERGAKASAMARRWSNKQLRWTGAAVAALCVDRLRECPVNVFEKNATPDAFALGGFFPRVSFDEDGWKTVKDGCAGQTQCVIEFTGDITVLKTHADVPLAMKFGRSTVHAARQPALGENWFVRPKPKLGFGNDTKAPRPKSDLPSGKPALPVRGLVKPRTF